LRVTPKLAAGYPRVGIVGGGQLARMMQQASIGLGIGVRVLALNGDESAAQVTRDVAIGGHDDLEALLAFSEGLDVVTFDHEHVPPAYLEQLEARGVAVRPGPTALVHAQDKVLMRQRLAAAGIPGPEWTVINEVADGTAFAERVGWPFILKTSRGGYDGKGVWKVDDEAQLEGILGSVALGPHAVWLGEELVAFVQELAAQVARSPHGQVVTYPVVRTVQTDGICTEVVAPAPGLDAERSVEAQRIAIAVAEELGCTGMLAVELFDTGDRLLVNELAMRPHNSGHWSIDGSVTSQFENHLRAVLDLPLGSPQPRSAWTVMVNVLGGPADEIYSAYRHCMARDPGLRIHMYGKDVRPGRKIGHVTVSSDDLDDALQRARHAAAYLTGTIEE
jgi:5-(carboxyamino)imidazole ribonucleotide synthase